MTTEIARLGEGLATEVAVEGSHLRMLAEMISEVTAFAKLLSTTFIFASEVQFHPVSGLIIYFDSLMPFSRDPLKFLW